MRDASCSSSFSYRAAESEDVFTGALLLQRQDGRVVKASGLGPDLRKKAWVRTPLLSNRFAPAAFAPVLPGSVDHVLECAAYQVSESNDQCRVYSCRGQGPDALSYAGATISRGIKRVTVCYAGCGAAWSGNTGILDSRLISRPEIAPAAAEFVKSGLAICSCPLAWMIPFRMATRRRAPATR